MPDWKRLCEQFLASEDVPHKTKNVLRESLNVVAEAFQNYSPNQLAMSFNGGKDCLVMLIIILAVVPHPSPLTIYIRTPNSFAEVDYFVEECAKVYKLTLTTNEQPMKDALQWYLDTNPAIQAVFVGIRRADPWASDLSFFQKTDHGWPDFMRVHPVIDWEYDDVWLFLRKLQIPYCPLYDEGYTSLGSTTTTEKNAGLRNADGTYRPAYELIDATTERAGRHGK